MAVAIALYTTEKGEAPDLFIADTGNECIEKVKRYFIDVRELEFHVETNVFALFNNIGSFVELSTWFEQNYCYYGVVMEQQ